MDIDNAILNYKVDIIDKLSELVSFKSVQCERKAGIPFGEENAKCLNRALDMAKDYGFYTKNLDNYCGYAEIGSGEEIIAIVAHLDVVPAGDNWKTDPFKAVVKEGKIYGRGTSDDKGAAVASMIALKIIKDMKIPLNKRIRLILGCAEETGSDCMKYYLLKEGDFKVGFTPDGDFPLLYGEKGHIRAKFKTKSSSIIDISGGTVANAVADECMIKVKSGMYNEKALKNFFENTNTEYNVESIDNMDTIIVKGVAAHASNPRLGKSAIYYAIKGLKEAGLEDYFIDYYLKRFNNECDGKGFLIECQDDYGVLTCVNGKIGTENGSIVGDIDIRVPVTLDSKEVVKKLKDVKDEEVDIVVNKYSETTFFDLNSKLVKTLLNVYQEVTGDYTSKPITTGGGTYAKSFKNCIAFGCKFQNKDNHIHKENEFVDIEELLLQVKLYVNAILKLLDY